MPAIDPALTDKRRLPQQTGKQPPALAQPVSTMVTAQRPLNQPATQPAAQEAAKPMNPAVTQQALEQQRQAILQRNAATVSAAQPSLTASDVAMAAQREMIAQKNAQALAAATPSAAGTRMEGWDPFAAQAPPVSFSQQQATLSHTGMPAGQGSRMEGWDPFAAQASERDGLANPGLPIPTGQGSRMDGWDPFASQVPQHTGMQLDPTIPPTAPPAAPAGQGSRMEGWDPFAAQASERDGLANPGVGAPPAAQPSPSPVQTSQPFYGAQPAQAVSMNPQSLMNSEIQAARQFYAAQAQQQTAAAQAQLSQLGINKQAAEFMSERNLWDEQRALAGQFGNAGTVRSGAFQRQAGRSMEDNMRARTDVLNQYQTQMAGLEQELSQGIKDRQQLAMAQEQARIRAAWALAQLGQA